MFSQYRRSSKILEYVDLYNSNSTGILNNSSHKIRHSVIITTLTNSGVTNVDLQKLLEANMNIIRFRMPHQSNEDKLELLSKIKIATAALCLKHNLPSWPVTTCIDLKTRIVRTGLLEEVGEYFILLNKDSRVILTSDTSFFDKCNAQKIFVDNPCLTTEVTIGMQIFINRDEIELICTEIIDDKSVRTVVVTGGKLHDMCLVSCRCAKASRPTLTGNDVAIIKFVMDNQVDGIIINYIEDAADIKKVKKMIGKKIQRPVIFSGITTVGGLDNIDEIAKESDGIVLLRDYLPYESSAALTSKVLGIQKWLSAVCQQAGKPLYLSGDILQTALCSGVILDSEISDVVNALQDGVTGFFLCDCDNIDYTIATVRLLNEICCNVEPFINVNKKFWRLTDQFRLPVNAAEAAVMSCVAVAHQIAAQVIVLPTMSGRTARAVLQLGPNCLVLPVCTNAKVAKMLQFFKCMIPLLYFGQLSNVFHENMAARIHFAEEFAVKMDLLRYGDKYAVLKRATDGSCYCDTITVMTVTVSNQPLGV